MSTRRTRFARITGAVLAMGLALAALSCAKKEESSQTAAESTPPPPAAPALTDANIAAIVLAANDADIANGNVAKDKTKNNEVRAFAVRMITDHTAVNKQAADLAKTLSLTPEENDASHGLKSGADSTRDELKKLDGSAFDKAYIDNEVAYHQAVIGMLEGTLIPGATNAELKALLQTSLPAFQAHLEHAQKMQASLTK